MSVELEWDGDSVARLVDDASAQTIIDMGHEVSRLAKPLAHEDTGTLRRSIHAASLLQDHSMDEALAHGTPPRPKPTSKTELSFGVDLEETRGAFLTPDDVKVPGGAELEVGSWVDYACVEETGRHHPFVHPAVEQVIATWFDKLKANYDLGRVGLASNSGWRRWTSEFYGFG